MLPGDRPSIYQSSKCFVTYGSVSHTDMQQVSRRGKPWSSLMELGFIHKVDLIMPCEVSAAVRRRLDMDRFSPQYYRVTMPLERVLYGAFFTEYIKRGNVLMMTEGRVTVDNTFLLRDGVLTLYLDKEAYERAGLVGKPYGTKGNRGLKPRWVVSYDLRRPSMLHGKKGFDRLLYASKKVLNRPLTWLFCNLEDRTPSPDPLQEYLPVKFTSSPSYVGDIETKDVSLLVPPSIMAEGNRSDLEMFASDLYEWLSLVRLGSPRADAADGVDPYLARYEAPGDASGKLSLQRISWQGFMSSEWLRELLAVLLTTCPSDAWFSLSATDFSTSISNTSDELVLLRPPKTPGEYLMWEIQKTG